MAASSSGRRSHAMDRRVQGVRLADIARRTGYSLATVSRFSTVIRMFRPKRANALIRS